MVVSHTWAQIVVRGPPQPVRAMDGPERPTQPTEMEVGTGIEPQSRVMNGKEDAGEKSANLNMVGGERRPECPFKTEEPLVVDWSSEEDPMITAVISKKRKTILESP